MDDGISSDENVIDDYYEIEPNTSRSSGNLRWNQIFQLNPISNFSRELPDHSPLTDFNGLNYSTGFCNPEDFFNQLFDESMYTRMVQETNSYAHDKLRKVLQGTVPFEQMDHHTHRQHS